MVFLIVALTSAAVAPHVLDESPDSVSAAPMMYAPARVQVIRFLRFPIIRHLNLQSGSSPAFRRPIVAGPQRLTKLSQRDVSLPEQIGDFRATVPCIRRSPCSDRGIDPGPGALGPLYWPHGRAWSRKVHSAPVPRVGGLAMAAGLFVATLLTVDLSPPVQGLLLGLMVLLLFGVWDDRVTLGYATKLAGQIIAVGLCMIVGGIHIGPLTLGAVDFVPTSVSTVVTFVFLIGITNA